MKSSRKTEDDVKRCRRFALSWIACYVLEENFWKLEMTKRGLGGESVELLQVKYLDAETLINSGHYPCSVNCEFDWSRYFDCFY